MRRFEDRDVERVVNGYPPSMRRKLLALRELIFEVARSTQGVGALDETLKWGEPAYVTSETKSGSTVRIAWHATTPTRYAMYFNCQTSLVAAFRKRFAGELEFEGNRAIVIGETDKIPEAVLRHCIEAALTYHRKKSKKSARPR